MCCKEGCERAVLAGHSKVKGIDYVNSTRMRLNSLLVCACTFTTSCLSTRPIYRPRNSIVRSPSLSQDLRVQEAKYRMCNLHDMIAELISTREPRCAANCTPVHVSVQCCLVFVQSVQLASCHSCMKLVPQLARTYN